MFRPPHLIIAGILILTASRAQSQNSPVATSDESGKITVEIIGELGDIQHPLLPGETPKQVWASVHVRNKELCLDCSNSLEARKALIAESVLPVSPSRKRKHLLVKGTMEFRPVKRAFESPPKPSPERLSHPAPHLMPAIEETEPVILVQSLKVQDTLLVAEKVSVEVTGIKGYISFESLSANPATQRVGGTVNVAGQLLLLDCRNSLEARKTLLDHVRRIGSTSRPPTHMIVTGTIDFPPVTHAFKKGPKDTSVPLWNDFTDKAKLVIKNPPEDTWLVVRVESLSIMSRRFQFRRDVP